MARKIIGLIMVCLFLGFTSTSYAASGDVWENMSNKLVRGVVNTLTGVLEIPAQITKGSNEGLNNSKILGGVTGLFNGLYHATGRTLSGAVDLATFWALDPASNEGMGIPLDAEYAWQQGEGFAPFDPSFAEATASPILRKLVRGVADGTLGIAELPGQIFQGDGLADHGITKGLWYFLSREMSAVRDLVTLLFPAPADNLGNPFEQ